MKYVWRGPFKVVRDGPYKWKIVNHYGGSERLGFTNKADADKLCRLMNEAQNYCDPEREADDWFPAVLK